MDADRASALLLAERTRIERALSDENDVIVDLESSKLGVGASNDEVNAYIEQIKKQNNLDDAKLAAALEQQGLTLETYRVRAHLFPRYWVDVGTIGSFYEANIQLTRPDAPFTFCDPRWPIYTHPRFLQGSRVSDCRLHDERRKGDPGSKRAQPRPRPGGWIGTRSPSPSRASCSKGWK